MNKRLPLATFLPEWLVTVGPTLRLATRLRYAGLVNGQILPHLGHVRLADLTPAQVSRWQADLQDAGLSPSTVGHARAVLRTAIGHAMRVGLVLRNVVTLTDPPGWLSPAPSC